MGCTIIFFFFFSNIKDENNFLQIVLEIVDIHYIFILIFPLPLSIEILLTYFDEKRFWIYIPFPSNLNLTSRKTSKNRKLFFLCNATVYTHYTYTYYWCWIYRKCWIFFFVNFCRLISFSRKLISDSLR